MAKTVDRTQEFGRRIEEAANDTKALHSKLTGLARHVTSLGYDFSTTQTYISVDADGNITGLNFSPAELNSALAALAQVLRVLNNQTTTQGDHIGSIEKLARP